MWENDLVWKWGEYTIIIYNSSQLCANLYRWSKWGHIHFRDMITLSNAWFACLLTLVFYMHWTPSFNIVNEKYLLLYDGFFVRENADKRKYFSSV